jgi:hypothetical protein
MLQLLLVYWFILCNESISLVFLSLENIKSIKNVLNFLGLTDMIDPSRLDLATMQDPRALDPTPNMVARCTPGFGTKHGCHT